MRDPLPTRDELLSRRQAEQTQALERFRQECGRLLKKNYQPGGCVVVRLAGVTETVVEAVAEELRQKGWSVFRGHDGPVGAYLAIR